MGFILSSISVVVWFKWSRFGQSHILCLLRGQLGQVRIKRNQVKAIYLKYDKDITFIYGIL